MAWLGHEYASWCPHMSISVLQQISKSLHMSCQACTKSVLLVITTCALEQHCCVHGLIGEACLPHSLLLSSHGHRMSNLYAKHHLGVCCQHHAIELLIKCMTFVPAPCLQLHTPTFLPILHNVELLPSQPGWLHMLKRGSCKPMALWSRLANL